MNFLLIHGSWHGAWCWYKVAPRLRTEGHRVIVPDLPGRGRAQRPRQLITLNMMAAHLVPLLPEGEKTTIVVHSRYGILASRLAELAPERIARTIYLASFMLPEGARAADYFRADKGSLLRPHISIGKLGMWDDLAPEIYHEGLYHDCSTEDVALGHSLLCREPLRPALARLALTAARYGSVPRAYIRLTEDRAVTPALQDRCLSETPVERVEELKASHSAYFSQPDALVKTILRLGGS
ncbi:alpha/beta fold hydrolase [Oceanicola sp. 502str15]|uniref:alpha/beta fold hydrolase n=1 Tax=Oceanicola sp. 502str15 TaxID=2696061 RepID=UPI00209510B2|nr:alpha/beta fold hydrolase [Oceanicola sp. 502str15]MCO6385138.1 alpha/beta fold hydrolase [Oceanicola sp. 502str15]